MYIWGNGLSFTAACDKNKLQIERDERSSHQVVLTRCCQRLCFTVSSTGPWWKQNYSNTQLLAYISFTSELRVRKE